MGAVLSFSRVARIIPSRKSRAHALRVTALVLSFAVLLFAGFHHRRDLGDMLVAAMSRAGAMAGKGHAWQGRPAAKGDALRLHDPRSEFVEARVGMLLFASLDSDICRRLLFDNRNGLTFDAGQVYCGQQPEQPSEHLGIERLLAMSKAFKK